MHQSASYAAGQPADELCALLCEAEALAAQGLRRAAAAICTSILQQHPGHKAASLTLSKVLKEAGRPEQAAQVVSAALQVQGPDVELLEQRGHCLLDQDIPEKALSSFQAALRLVESQLDQYEALRLYAQMLADRQAWNDVAKLSVRLLAKHPKDRKVQQLLACAVQQPEALQQLQYEVASPAKPAEDIAAALSYLATTLKAQGAVQQAVQLYRHAVCLQPRSAVHALALANGLELLYDYTGVMKVLLDYCAVNEDSISANICLRDICDLPWLQLLSTTAYSAGSRTWLDSSVAIHSSLALADQQSGARLLYCGGALTAAAELLQLAAGAGWNPSAALHTTLIRGSSIGRESQNTTSRNGGRHTAPGQQQLQHYAAWQFWEAIRGLKPGSWVVLMLGELDCREGMLTALQKLKYDSLKQAVGATAGVFSSLALELVTQHRLKVMVHPVPPVLMENHDVLQQFELAVRKQILELQAASHTSSLQGSLAYLDVFQQLMPAACAQCGEAAEDGSVAMGEQDMAKTAATRLKQQQAGPGASRNWSLDGVHLHPAYVGLLEAAMDAAVAAGALIF
eukprot:gene4975-5217_t